MPLLGKQNSKREGDTFFDIIIQSRFVVKK